MPSQTTSNAKSGRLEGGFLLVCWVLVVVSAAYFFGPRGSGFPLGFAILYFALQFARTFASARHVGRLVWGCAAVLVAMIGTIAAGGFDSDRYCSPEQVVKIEAIQGALKAYHREHGEPPPLFTISRSGQPALSWQVVLLPYLGRSDLYERFDLEKDPTYPANWTLYDRCPDEYRLGSNCPPEFSTLVAVAEGEPDGPEPRIKYIVLSKHQQFQWTVPSFVPESDGKFQFRRRDTLCILSAEGDELPLEPTGVLR